MAPKKKDQSKEKARVKAQQKAKAQKVRATQKADKKAKGKRGIAPAPEASRLPTSVKTGRNTTVSRGINLKG